RGWPPITAGAGRQTTHLGARVLRATSEGPTTADDVRTWREQVNAQVAIDAGFAYQAYVRLKLASVRAFGARLIFKLRGPPAQLPMGRIVAEIIDAWAVRKGIVYERADSEALEFAAPTAEHLPGWVTYLLAFDVKYRERRLHFLIEGQNPLYDMLDQKPFAGLDPLRAAPAKREFYGPLAPLRRRDSAAFYSADVHKLVAELFPAAPSADEIKNLHGYAHKFVERHFHKLDQLIERLAAEIDLDASTRDIDELLASLNPAEWDAEARRE